MFVTADLQLHSKFSRAVSRDMVIPQIASWAARKGIGLVATGDWTHPLWMREIQENLVEDGSGLLKLKPEIERDNTGIPKTNQSTPVPRFLLATEVSCIYSQSGKGRRIHTLVWVPSLSSALRINQEMTKRGCNLMSDGRPIIGLTSIALAELVLSVEPKALIIPAHAWTPWFSVYGSMSGFDSLDEAFGPFAKHIRAVETGLSSSPSMNWRISELDNRSIVSFSDAHSGRKLGREATVFDIPGGKLSYDAIANAINGNTKNRIAYTIEFYPEEGKYHYTGHRACNIRWGPEETKTKGTTCPVCGKPLTQGVLQRVEELAGRSEESLGLETVPMTEPYEFSEGVRMTRSTTYPRRPPFVMLVPLIEIISEAVGSPVASPKTQTPYFQLTDMLGGEFSVLLHSSASDIAKLAGERVAHGVSKVRTGDIVIDPGYDGVFGVVNIWKKGDGEKLLDDGKEQLSIF